MIWLYLLGNDKMRHLASGLLTSYHRSLDWAPLQLLFIFGYCLLVIDGELRCHCNESGCVATSYMCKSEVGRCYTAIEPHVESGSRRTYGCIESLPENQQARCQVVGPTSGVEEAEPTKPTLSTPGAEPFSITTLPAASRERVRRSAVKVVGAQVRSQENYTAKESGETSDRTNGDDSGAGKGEPNSDISRASMVNNVRDGTTNPGSNINSNRDALSAGPHHRRHNLHPRHRQQLQKVYQQEMSVLLCCTAHMCNYNEGSDSRAELSAKMNTSLQRSAGVSSSAHGQGDKHLSKRRNHDDADRDLWFKAAVIAVPIAGGFILVVLVLLAVRMLKSDSNRHRRLIQQRRDRSLTKAQLYISDHFVGGVGGRTFHMSTSQTKSEKAGGNDVLLLQEKLMAPSTGHSSSAYSDKVPIDTGGSGAVANGPSVKLNGSSYSSTAVQNTKRCSRCGGFPKGTVSFNTPNTKSGLGTASADHYSRGGCPVSPCCKEDLRHCCGRCCSQRDHELFQLREHSCCSPNSQLARCSTCGGSKGCPSSLIGDLPDSYSPSDTSLSPLAPCSQRHGSCGQKTSTCDNSNLSATHLTNSLTHNSPPPPNESNSRNLLSSPVFLDCEYPTPRDSETNNNSAIGLGSPPCSGPSNSHQYGCCAHSHYCQQHQQRRHHFQSDHHDNQYHQHHYQRHNQTQQHPPPPPRHYQQQR